MVLILLNTIKFEAERFETRTMPTPDMKAKEMIYWIKVNTTDKRLVTDLQRFLEGSSQFIELHVPSAFIAVRTELESYRASSSISSSSSNNQSGSSGGINVDTNKSTQANQQQDVEERFFVEIILRRLLPEPKGGQIQAPYG